MAKQDAETLAARSVVAWGLKDNWKALLSECYDFALPERNPYGQTQGGEKTSPKVYDSTLQTAATKLANRLQYDLFPMGQHWAELVPGAFVPSDVREEERAAFYDLQVLLFTAIQISNFDLSIAEWLLELVVAGTAIMVVTDGGDLNPIVYRCVSQAHVAFLEGAIGTIDFITIKHKLRIDQIKPQWPDAKNIPTPTDKDKGFTQKVDVEEICYYDYDLGLWHYSVILKEGEGKNSLHKEMVHREYNVSPITVSRWSKSVEEVQGRSLVMAALPDARVLSSVKNFLLKQAALSILGVFLVKSEGVVNANTAKVFPGAMIPVRQTGGSTGASIEPLQVGGSTNLAQLVIQDLQESINKVMLNTGLPELSDGVRSATEFVERMKDMQQSIGAPFSRILREGIVPMLEATFQILGERGLIEDYDGGQIKLNSGNIDVRFTSPLVQSQALREVEALVQTSGIVQQIAGDQAAQLTALSIKIEDVYAWVGERLRVDPKIMRDKQERDKLQEQAGEVAAANQGGDPMGSGAMEEMAAGGAVMESVMGV